MRSHIAPLALLFVFFCSLQCLAVPDTLRADTLGLPAKWKNESVVILNYQYSFSYQFYYGMAPTKRTSIQIRYYVRDKWGVDALSRLNLPASIDGSDNDMIGTVHKANGNKVDIRKDQLIPRKEKINFSSNSTRRGLSLESEIDQKLAVPSLEVGDILEINITSSKSNPPDFIFLVNKFPMLHFEATVETTQPFNQGSSVKVQALHVNTNAESMEYEGESFKVSRDSVDKYKSEILSDNLKDLPYVLIRFKVSGLGQDEYGNMDLNSKNSNLQLYLARQIYMRKSSEEKKIAHEILAALSKKQPQVKDTVAYVRDAYYLYREIIARENLFYGYNSYDYKSDRFFSCVLSRVLFKKKIDHRIFLTQSDHYPMPSKCDNFIGATYGVCIPGKDLKLFNPLYSYDPENIPSYFEGQKFYSFSANKHYKRYKYIWYFWLYPLAGVLTSPITVPIYIAQSVAANNNRKFDLTQGEFPSVKSEVNQILSEINVKKIDLEAQTVFCETKTSCLGKMKINESERICSASSHFLKSNNAYRKLSMTSIDKPITDYDTLNLNKRMKHMAERDLYRDGFNLKKLISHKVLETNFFEASKPFVYSVSFLAKDMVVPFEEYVVFNAGNFIGKQLSVPEDTSGRENDFYIPYSKQLINRISINVPEGYAVENLNDFNVRAETNAGVFSSDASVSGNTVLIVTKKVYNFRFLEEKKAPEVYGFLAAAEKYYDKKMIFKKLAGSK